jgi:hypothetical protein
MLIRALYIRMILVFAILLLSASAGDAQLTRRPQPQVTPDQLREAQTALQEATQVAGRAPDPAVISEFVQLWFRMDRAKAPEAVEGVYSLLRAAAAEAQILAVYQKFTNSAHALLSSYASIDPQRVAALAPGWPDPAAVLGQAAQVWYAQAKSHFNSIVAPELAAGAPRQALNMLGDPSSGGTVDYAANGRMLMKLNMSGQKDEALKLADDTVAAFSRQELTNDAINRYRSFLGQLARVDADRYMRAVDQLLPMLSKLTNPRAGGVLTVGERTLELTAPETVLVSIAVNLSFNSGLAAKTLDLIPGLKRKTDDIGLIDEVLNRHPASPYNLTYSFDGVSGGGGGTMPQGGPGSEKYLGLRGRPSGAAPRGQPMPSLVLQGQPAPSTPASVPVSAEMQKMNQEMMLLIGQAKKAGESDPAQAAQILQKAVDLVKQFEPLTRRAVSLQEVMSAYRDILGKPNPELIKEGFTLLSALAEQEKRLPFQPGMITLGSASRTTGSRAIDVEASLVSDLAMYSFDEAIHYVRSMPEDQRMICLVRIVQALSGN